MELYEMVGKTIAKVTTSKKATVSGFFFNEVTITFTDGTKITI